jgi:O-antigen ligase/polysaccharide polymerase Wzy-like membrane protein
MTVSNDPAEDKPEPRPVLKPYGGVGDNFFQRHLPLLVGLIAAAVCLPYGFYYAIFTPWLLVPMIVPIILLMLITIWALPDTQFLPDKALERMFFAFFAALVLWPNYLAVDLPGLPWITLGRVVNVPMVLLLVITVSTSLPFRQRMRDILASSPVVWKALVIFVVVQTLSLPLSHRPNFSFAHYVIDQFNNTAVFFICAYIFAKPGRAQIWAWMFWFLAMGVAVMGFLEFRQKLPLWSGHVPAFLLIQDETVQRILAGASRGSTGQYRASSVFSTPLGLSEFLALALPFAMHFAASKHYRPWMRFAAGASVPFMVLVIIYTDSRLGIFGLFIAMMLYLLYRAIQHWRRNRGAIMPMAVLVAYPTIFMAFIVLSFVSGRVKNKVWGTGQYEDSNRGRMEQLQMGIPKVLKHPFGHGPATAGETLGYTNPAGTLTIDNWLLAIALDYGILGLFSFCAMFGVSAYTASRHSFTTSEKGPEIELLIPLAICMVSFLVIKTVFAQDDNHALVFMMMGVLAALSHRARQLDPAVSARVAAGRHLAVVRPASAPQPGRRAAAVR